MKGLFQIKVYCVVKIGYKFKLILLDIKEKSIYRRFILIAE